MHKHKQHNWGKHEKKQIFKDKKYITNQLLTGIPPGHSPTRGTSWRGCLALFSWMLCDRCESKPLDWLEHLSNINSIKLQLSLCQKRAFPYKRDPYATTIWAVLLWGGVLLTQNHLHLLLDVGGPWHFFEGLLSSLDLLQQCSVYGCTVTYLLGGNKVYIIYTTINSSEHLFSWIKIFKINFNITMMHWLLW